MAGLLSVSAERVSMGSNVSPQSLARMSSSASLLGFVSIGSILPLRSFARIGSSVSMFRSVFEGSQVHSSLTKEMRVNSSLSVHRVTQLGSLVSS